MALPQKAVSILTGALAAGLLAPAIAYAGATKGGCNPTSVKYSVSESTFFQTSSNTYVNLGQAAVTFKQGGTDQSCVIVRFSGQPIGGGGNGNIEVRALLDGSVVSVPGEVQVSGGDDTANQARSFDFVFPDVAPGKHTVRMQFRSPSNVMIDMNRHTTIVQFVP